MSEATVVEKAVAKPKTEVTMVKMSDGREVGFAGKRKVNKETVIDNSKIEYDEASGIVQFAKGAVKVRMDFRNGETRLIDLPLHGESGIARFAGHGGEQKFGDELAAPADKPLSEDDMVLAIDDLNTEIQAGKWGKGRATGGGGVSGASLVVKAIMEASGKDLATVKAFLEKKLAADPKLTRPALYGSFKVKGTKTGDIIARLEDEKRAAEASKAGVNADESLGELANA